MALIKARAALISAVFLAACGPAGKLGTPEVALKTLLEQNLKACQAKDLAGMMGTFHSQAPSYLLAKSQAQALFERFDLERTAASREYPVAAAAHPLRCPGAEA